MIFSMSMVLCPTHNYFDVSSTFDFSTFSVLVVTNAICTLHHSAMYRLGSSKAFHWLCKVLKIKPKTKPNTTQNRGNFMYLIPTIKNHTLPHFDVLCDLLQNRLTATWNPFVLYNDQKRKRTDTHKLTRFLPLDCPRICASLGIF